MCDLFRGSLVVFRPICARAVRARDDAAARKRISKQEFYLCVDAAELRLSQSLQFRPHRRIETKQERLLVRHQPRRWKRRYRAMAHAATTVPNPNARSS